MFSLVEEMKRNLVCNILIHMAQLPDRYLLQFLFLVPHWDFLCQIVINNGPLLLLR